VSGAILAESDDFWCKPGGAALPLMMHWPAGTSRRCAAARGMKTSIAWSPAAGLNVASVERREQEWAVTVHSRRPTFCPGCGAQSKSRHSTYWRTFWDLSAQGAPVIVQARLGRWRCRNQQCDRRIFTERVPGLAAPFARRATRLAEIVRLLGHSAGGRPSERLMRRLGMPVSDTTILASVKHHAKASSENGVGVAVRVAGVDDWAWRKGSNYGTIIVDLERREVVDVLPDRSAATMASWFKDHPSVEVVSRDRAGLYAEGAPQARQIADRFHLLQNFCEIVERQLGRYEAPVPEARVSPDDGHVMAAPPSDCGSDVAEQTRLMRRGRRAVRHQLFDEIRSLFEGGNSIGEIARKPGLGRRRAERWVRRIDLPDRNTMASMPSNPAYFSVLLERRWAEGITKVRHLLDEIRRRMLDPMTGRVISPPTAAALCVKPRGQMSARQVVTVVALKAASPEFTAMRRLATRFRGLLRGETVDELDAWLIAARASGIYGMQRFARTIHQDIEAVRNAVSEPWSNGQTEGQINKLKTLKRAMYGRANVDLLRARMMPL
jgi:transposase